MGLAVVMLYDIEVVSEDPEDYASRIWGVF